MVTKLKVRLFRDTENMWNSSFDAHKEAFFFNQITFFFILQWARWAWVRLHFSAQHYIQTLHILRIDFFQITPAVISECA